MTEKVFIRYNKTSTLRGLFETDHIFKQIKSSNNFYELKLLEKIKSLNLSGTFVDAGANIGNHTLFFSTECNADKIISIEMDKKIFEVLSTNVNENNLQNVTLINVGVGEQEKFVSISDVNETNVGMTKVLDDGGDTKIVTLDSILENENNISLIKLDVEGYEKNALLGLTKTLSLQSPILVTELENQELFNEFEKIISPLGYKTDKVNYARTPTYIWVKEENNYDFIYLIPSYNRFEKAKNLVNQIKTFKQNSLIIFLNDGSDDKRYVELKNYDNIIYLENETNGGKQGYWKTVNKIFSELSKYKFKHCCMLNDDFVLIDNFDNIINSLKNNEDVIRLFTPKSIPGKNWNFESWVDGAFCAPYSFFQKLNFELFPITNFKNIVSSGVGLQMTKRLNALGIKVKNFGSLVHHNGNDDSKMHPKIRENDPLIGKMYTDLSYDFSVIIPTFKNSTYLDECLGSIVNSIGNLKCEVLVGIDSCSDTLNHVRNNRNKYPSFIKFYFFKKNLGPYVVKNTLSLEAMSENLIFFDSDDIMTENFIIDSLRYVGEFDCLKPKYKNFQDEFDYVNQKTSEAVTSHGEGVFTIKKNIFLYLNGFEGWECAADSEFMKRLHRNRYKIKHSENVSFHRRIHSQGLTTREDTGFSSPLRKKYQLILKQKTDMGPLAEMKISEFSIVDDQFTYEPEILIHENQKQLSKSNLAIDKVINEKKTQVVKTNQSQDKRNQIDLVKLLLTNRRTVPPVFEQPRRNTRIGRIS